MPNTDQLAGRESSPSKPGSSSPGHSTPKVGSELSYIADRESPDLRPSREASVTSSTYGPAEISGASKVHQGDTNIHIEQLIQEYRLPFEILTQGTRNAFFRQQARLSPLITNYNYAKESQRGRDNRRRTSETDSRRGPYRDSSPYRYGSQRPSPQDSSRSPSSSRYSRSNFPSRDRRRSSLSRGRRYDDYRTPASSITSSANSMLSFREEAEIQLSVENMNLPTQTPFQPDCDQAMQRDNRRVSAHGPDIANNPARSTVFVDDHLLPPIDMAVGSGKDDSDELSLTEIRRLLRTALETIDRHEMKKSRKRLHSPGDST